MESPHIKFSAIECVMNNVHMNMRFTLVTAIVLNIYGLLEYIKVKGITTNQIISCSRFDMDIRKVSKTIVYVVLIISLSYINDSDE